MPALFVPVVTPFDGGKPDLASLAKLCTHLIERGVDGLVACGSTGEAASLTEDEFRQVTEAVVSAAGGAVPVLVGVLASSTATALSRVEHAGSIGASGALVMPPTLLGVTTDELRTHYRTLADSGRTPVYLYNFPDRQGVRLAPELVLELAGHPNVVGIKQSVSTIDDDVLAVLAHAPESFATYSGKAELLWPLLAAGAAGGIVAAANLMPREIVQLCRAAGDGDLARGRKLHREIWPSLAPIAGVASLKHGLWEAGVITSPEVRPPLLPGTS